MLGDFWALDVLYLQLSGVQERNCNVRLRALALSSAKYVSCHLCVIWIFTTIYHYLRYLKAISESSRFQKCVSHIFAPYPDRNSWVVVWWFEMYLCSMLASMTIRFIHVCIWNGVTRFAAEWPQCLTHRSCTESSFKTVCGIKKMWCQL